MEEITELFVEVNVEVKFSEVDALQIVWHGHYIRYFEDAREAFGKQYGIGYLDIYEHGFTIPIVQVSCNYKAALKYGDTAVVRCTYVKTLPAKIIFAFTIKKPGSDTIIAEGSTVQVFLDDKGILQLYSPEFYDKWKIKMNLA